MATVVNKYKVNMTDPDIEYIGRGSIWGNPYPIDVPEGRTREVVVSMYRVYLWGKIYAGEITKEMLLELDGKRLCCYCAPKPCHGDVLLKAIKWAKGDLYAC